MVSPSGLVVDPSVVSQKFASHRECRGAAGPDASVLEWPRHFCDTTLNGRESLVDDMFYSMPA